YESELVDFSIQVIEPQQHVVVQIPVEPYRHDFLFPAAYTPHRSFRRGLANAAWIPVQIQVAVARRNFPRSPIRGYWVERGDDARVVESCVFVVGCQRGIGLGLARQDPRSFDIPAMELRIAGIDACGSAERHTAVARDIAI